MGDYYDFIIVLADYNGPGSNLLDFFLVGIL